MKAICVSLNGREVCAAGVGAIGVLSVLLVSPRSASRSLFFHVGGVDGAGDHVSWLTPEVAVGDVVTARVSDAAAADLPSSRHSRDPSYRAFLLRHARESLVAASRAFAADPARELRRFGRGLRHDLADVPGRLRTRLPFLRQDLRRTVFGVNVNDRPICRAGVAAGGTLTASLTWVGKVGRPPGPASLSVFGGDPRATGLLRWEAPSVDVGDQVSIEVRLCEEWDPPSRGTAA